MPSWPAPPTGLQTFLRPVKIQINNKRQNNSEIEENKRSCWPFCWMEWLSSICYCMISPYATLHISFFLLLTVCNLLSCYIFTWTVCCDQWTSSMCKYQCSTYRYFGFSLLNYSVDFCCGWLCCYGGTYRLCERPISK